MQHEFVAFQTVDEEGDIWCNTALLFPTEEAVEAFFANPTKVVETLDLEVKADESPEDCITISRANIINTVVMNLKDCGKLTIARMGKGFVIEQP